MGRRYKTSELLEARTTSFNPKDARDAFELLDMCVKALQDRRAATRERALTAVAGALEGLPPLVALDSRCYNIFALCGVRIKDGSLKEARLAYRTVGLLAVTLRAGVPWVLAQSFLLLSRTLRDQGDAPTLVAAIDCLAAVTFAGARGKEDVERSVKAVWDLIAPTSVSRPSKINGGASTTKTSPQVLVAALSTWSFFTSTIVSVTDAHRKADSAVWDATVASLAGHLENDDRAVRMAAGEALALCVELNLTQHTPRKDVAALAAKVSELAYETAGRGVDNAMLPEQRDLFRQIAAFIDHGEPLEMSLGTSQEGCVALQVSTWAKHVQLTYLRRLLGNGFVKHVQGNELFTDAFSYGADERKVLSISKKKQNSKMDTDLMKKVRNDWSWLHWHIFCRYPYTVHHKPKTLLQIGWQAQN